MKFCRDPLLSLARAAALSCALLTCAAQADDYADISQMVRAGQFNPALARVDTALAAKPTDPQLRFLKGVIQRNLGKATEAVAIFSKLTEDFPELPEPYNNLAVLYAGQGQFDKARAALEMAIRTNPSYATAHENLGDVYARLASQAYNKALQLDHNNVAVAPKLALIREVFKPNLGNPKPGAALTPAAAAVAVNPAPASLPAASGVKPPAAPVPAAKPAPAAPVSAAPVLTPPTQATPAPAPVKPATSASALPSAAGVEAAVAAWARAWSSKDVDAYLGAYSPEFQPPGQQSLEAWKQDRRARIVGKSHISVSVTELRVSVQGDHATARFRQAYKADRLAVSSRKTLELQRSADGWLIRRESTGN